MDIDQARVAGGWARENGRGIETCPTYALGEQGEPYRKAWKAGWLYANERMKRANR